MEPVISNLSKVTKSMITHLEVWLRGVKAGKLHPGAVCPFDIDKCKFSRLPKSYCHRLFDNLPFDWCPCRYFGQNDVEL